MPAFTPSVLQWSLLGFCNNLDNLKLLTSRCSPSVILLQETNFKPNEFLQLNRFNIIRKNRLYDHRASGGVAILIKENIQFTTIDLNTDLQAIAIKIDCSSITVCSVYIPNSFNFSLEHLIDLPDQLPAAYIWSRKLISKINKMFKGKIKGIRNIN